MIVKESEKKKPNFVNMIFSDISQNISRALIFIVWVFPENSQAKMIQT